VPIELFFRNSFDTNNKEDKISLNEMLQKMPNKLKDNTDLKKVAATQMAKHSRKLRNLNRPKKTT